MIKTNAGKILSLIAVLTVMITSFIGLSVTASAATSVHYGLTQKNGTIMLNGKPYYSMGVNLYDAFLVYLRGSSDQNHVEKEFKQLKESKIPVARISMCGYNSSEFNDYMEYKDFYFSCIDKVIGYAEKYQIGIVFDLCWAIDAIPDYVWAYRSDIGDANGEVVKTAKKYVADVVTRYKNSPAVWAWEIGNEYNLDCDLAGVVTRTEKEDVSSDDVHVYYEQLAKVIRSIDSYRLITGGDSEPRTSAYNLYKNNSWQLDTYEEMASMMKKLSPSPMNMMSVHVYQDGDNSEKGAGSINENMIEDFDAQVKNYMKAAADAGQALFVGEFGIMERTCASADVAKKILRGQYDAFMKHGVQLSCIWVYGKDDNDPMNISPTNNLAYQYNMIVNGNVRYRNEGKQDSASYWSSAKNLVYKKSTTTTKAVTKPKTTGKATNTAATQTGSAASASTDNESTANESFTTAGSSETGTSITAKDTDTDPGNSSLLWIIIGCGAVVVVIACGITFVILKKKKLSH